METNRRRAPTCGYCCQEGHNVRSCREPDMLQVRERFKNMMRNHERIEYIRGWINQINNTNLLKMVVMRYIGIGFHTAISKQDIVERTMQFIYEQHRHELQQTISNVNRYVRQLDNMRIVLTPTMLYESYNMYFNDEDISDEENTMVCAIILDMPSTNMVLEHMVIDYLVLARIECYLTHILRQTTEQILVQMMTPQVQPHIVQPVEYIYTESTVPPPENTDSCPICFDDLKWRDTYTTDCGHHFCQKCIQATIKQLPSTHRCHCPMCRTPLEQMYYYDMQKYAMPRQIIVDLTQG